MEKLRAAKVGIMCREELVPALLFADDMVIFVEGEDELKRGLGGLMKENECIQMWGDAYKKKGCKENNVHILSWWRHGQNGPKLQIFIGCIVNEHMDCREMVGKRAMAGRGARSA